MKTAALYIHIPFCKSKCFYCDFFSISCAKISTFYLNALVAEATLRKNQFAITTISSIYIGGGTPSLLSEQQLEFLFYQLQRIFAFENTIEITIELNPDDVNARLLAVLAQLPVTRISLGIQSMNDSVLQAANRRSRSEINTAALRSCKTWAEKTAKTFSVDVIAGLPHETKKTFMSGLQTIIDFMPQHISLYALSLEENTPLHKLVQKKHILIDEEKNAALWIRGNNFLQKNHYLHYEVSNFAKIGFESRHNMTYWNLHDYLGIGSGATGTIQNYRYENTTDIVAWQTNALQAQSAQDFLHTQKVEILTQNTQILEYFMMGFRKRIGIEKSDFENRFAKEIDAYLEPTFSQWGKKLLTEKNQHEKKTYYCLTEKGLLFLNRFLLELTKNLDS